jgi:hypothetical protein
MTVQTFVRLSSICTDYGSVADKNEAAGAATAAVVAVE